MKDLIIILVALFVVESSDSSLGHVEVSSIVLSKLFINLHSFINIELSLLFIIDATSFINV